YWHGTSASFLRLGCSIRNEWQQTEQVPHFLSLINNFSRLIAHISIERIYFGEDQNKASKLVWIS
ncbi:hypothetical protein ACOIC8_29025, partial [Klebsiella pneumoniae]|uniref:hypothetical protein n=1 Tax=Klebsiella pneumoniae TaxID=573 RepID=UPI003B59FB7A